MSSGSIPTVFDETVSEADVSSISTVSKVSSISKLSTDDGKLIKILVAFGYVRVCMYAVNVLSNIPSLQSTVYPISSVCTCVQTMVNP